MDLGKLAQHPEVIGGLLAVVAALIGLLAALLSRRPVPAPSPPPPPPPPAPPPPRRSGGRGLKILLAMALGAGVAALLFRHSAISGEWVDPMGVPFRIASQGKTHTIQAVLPDGGRFAGQGTFDGQTFRFDIHTNGSNEAGPGRGRLGSGVLRLSADRSLLEGEIHFQDGIIHECRLRRGSR
jgi:hypothetical protein